MSCTVKEPTGSVAIYGQGNTSLKIFLELRKTSTFGVFAVGAKPQILEFLRIIRRTSDFAGFAAGADPPKSE